MIILNAMGKSLGRLASETAVILRGKNMPDFAPNKAPSVKVKIINLDKLNLRESKVSQKRYKSHSGYPGGIKITAMKKALEKKGIEYIFTKTVMGMLPKNKLRSKIIKNLIYGEKK